MVKEEYVAVHRLRRKSALSDLYATARLDVACMRPDGYEGNEQGILQSIFESWDLTTHYTQF